MDIEIRPWDVPLPPREFCEKVRRELRAAKRRALEIVMWEGSTGDDFERFENLLRHVLRVSPPKGGWK